MCTIKGALAESVVKNSSLNMPFRLKMINFSTMHVGNVSPPFSMADVAKNDRVVQVFDVKTLKMPKKNENNDDDRDIVAFLAFSTEKKMSDLFKVSHTNTMNIGNDKISMYMEQQQQMMSQFFRYHDENAK